MGIPTEYHMEQWSEKIRGLSEEFAATTRSLYCLYTQMENLSLDGDRARRLREVKDQVHALSSSLGRLAGEKPEADYGVFTQDGFPRLVGIRTFLDASLCVGRGERIKVYQGGAWVDLDHEGRPAVDHAA